MAGSWKDILNKNNKLTNARQKMIIFIIPKFRILVNESTYIQNYKANGKMADV
jgi:hypothetical protein